MATETNPSALSSESLSLGHICFHGEFEFFERPDGEVYRAKSADVIMTDGYRFGRWECSRAQFDRFRDVIIPPEPAPVAVVEEVIERTEEVSRQRRLEDDDATTLFLESPEVAAAAAAHEEALARGRKLWEEKQKGASSAPVPAVPSSPKSATVKSIRGPGARSGTKPPPPVTPDSAPAPSASWVTSVGLRRKAPK